MFAKKLLCTALAVFLAAGSVCAQEKGLSERQKSIVLIAAHTAAGQMPELDRELAYGLDNGLTVNEIKEILVQLYAYTGFPRSLNAINAFMQVREARKSAGITDEVGKEPTAFDASVDRDLYGARVHAKLGRRRWVFEIKYAFCGDVVPQKLVEAVEQVKNRRYGEVPHLGSLTRAALFFS